MGVDAVLVAAQAAAVSVAARPAHLLAAETVAAAGTVTAMAMVTATLATARRTTPARTTARGTTARLRAALPGGVTGASGSAGHHADQQSGRQKAVNKASGNHAVLQHALAPHHQ